MDTFIDRIISFAKTKYQGDYRKLCVVFPTKRACLIFRNKFAEAHNKPVWSPGIMSIGDFVSRHVKMTLAEEIPLLLALFDVYKKYWPEQDFGRFYPWGQMLINDFDEVDKQLSDPSRIFSTISELKKIEAAFLPEPESLHWIGEFIDSFNEEKLTRLQNEFVKTWDRLRQMYAEYNIVLESKEIGYEGKGYRTLIDNLKRNKFHSQWEHFVFAGFYGFSRSEEDFIKRISEIKEVELFWDADKYYVQNPIHEAGYYFRKTSLFNTQTDFILSDFKNSSKKIEITGVPMQAGQAKYAGELLLKLQGNSQTNLNKTAIILPDENMLFPVLYSLPASVDPINVTMGYPLKHSQFAEFVNLLHEVHSQRSISNSGEYLFPAIYVERLLNHPLVSSAVPNIEIHANKVHLNHLTAEAISSCYNFTLSGLFFTKIDSSVDLFLRLESIFNFIINSFAGKVNHAERFEETLMKFILHEIVELKNQLQGHIDEVDIKTSWQMVIECVSNLKVPFSGEPVKGLQVMGFLETRALDFETLIILNVNEGILPGSGTSRSFIPYSLRKGFGLSTFEDQDASFAYHFYRLLHKAKNVYLIYNTEVNKTGGGEPGRFLLQIKHELKKYMGNRLEITENTVNLNVDFPDVSPISIQKNEEILKILDQYKPVSTTEQQRYFSSSALTSYINCSLQFYFNYVANLKENIEKHSWIEPVVFGNILHGAIENLYRQTDLKITSDIIDELLSKSDKAVDEAILAHYFTEVNSLEGYDIILSEVIKELVKRILQTDKKEAPFEINGLEVTYTVLHKINDNLEVMLKGTFDRLDEVHGVTRIIDYKTGKVDLKSKSIDQLFSDPSKKVLFQLYLYTLIFRKINPEKVSKAGIYMARDIGSGILWPGSGTPFSEEELEEFSFNLNSLISEILNPEINFSQTTEIERCEFCTYKMICHR